MSHVTSLSGNPEPFCRTLQLRAQWTIFTTPFLTVLPLRDTLILSCSAERSGRPSYLAVLSPVVIRLICRHLVGLGATAKAETMNEVYSPGCCLFKRETPDSRSCGHFMGCLNRCVSFQNCTVPNVPYRVVDRHRAHNAARRIVGRPCRHHTWVHWFVRPVLYRCVLV